MVKDLLREIKANLYQFIALTLITMLGVGFFVGIQVTGYNMRKTGDAYMEERSVLDFVVRHTYGIDQEMIDEIDELIVGKVHGYIDDDSFARSDKFDDVVKVILLNDATKNDITLIEGRLPIKENEVVIDHVMNELFGLELNDEIKLIKNELFKTSDVKIVGFVESSLFLNLERGHSRLGVGKIQGFVYAKDLEEVNEDRVFTGIRVVDSDADAKYLIEKNTETISENRFNRIIEPELEKLKDAEKEYEEGKLKAEAEFLRAEQELEAAEAKLEVARVELENGINELSFIPVTTGTLDERLAFAKASYDKARDLLNQAIKGIENEIEEAESEEVKEYLQKSLDERLLELNQLTAPFETGYNQLKQGVDEYNKGVKELEAGKLQLEEEKIKTNKELADAKKQIESAKNKINNQSHGSIILQEREDLVIGYREFYDDSNRIEKIGRVFPIIFFLVSVLVTLSTVTRLIDENRMEMGVYKALGYSSIRTSMKYVMFTFLTWFIGSSLGLYFGFDFIPRIIYDAYRIMYQTPDMVGGLVITYAVFPLVISFVTSVGVTFVKAMLAATEKTANLMRPVAPKSGQRILLERINFIWKRLTFLYKVSFRNLFRNKTRFLMTLLGIGGTTGLLIVGFGIKHSIYSIVDKQFDDIIQYDGLVFFEDDDFYLDGFSSYTNLYVESNKVKGFEYSIYAGENLREMNDYISLRDRKSKQDLEIEHNDVILTEKLAKLLDLKVGDMFEIYLNDLPITLQVDGITENYANHYIYTSISKLEDVSKLSLEPNMMLFKTELENTDRLASQILESDDVLAVQFLDEIAATYQEMMKSFDIVIVVVVGAALALEILVLTNLISMNMSERTKELATLKVLGFYKQELASYILRENIILTLLSTLFGFVFGKLLHYFVIAQAEIDMVRFNYELQFSSYLYSFLLTLGLSILINYIMSRRANDVNMSEALKSFDE